MIPTPGSGRTSSSIIVSVAAISVLHAKGSSAFGQLLISEDISRYTTIGGLKPGTTTRSGGGSPPVLGSNQ